nr:hypothetical protein [Tanacetum cinerariifolium]
TGGIIKLIYADEDVTLEDAETAKDDEVEKNADDDEPEPAELKEVIDADDDVVDVVAHVTAELTPPSPTIIPPPPQQEVTSTLPPSPHQSPIAPSSSPPPQPQPLQTTTISMDLLNNLLETCTTLTMRV